MGSSVFLPEDSPWTEEPDGLHFMGSQSQTRLKRLHACMHGFKTLNLTYIMIQRRFIFLFVWISRTKKTTTGEEFEFESLAVCDAVAWQRDSFIVQYIHRNQDTPVDW